MINFTAVSLLMAFSSITSASSVPYLATNHGSLEVNDDEPPSYIVNLDNKNKLPRVERREKEGAEETENLVASAEIPVEDYVREYFSDIPVMIDIARCESTFRHYDKNGNVLRGVVNKSDIGVMQINTYYHGETAEKKGIDLYTLEGNLAYARDLYKRQGVKPWVHSSKCWNKA